MKLFLNPSILSLRPYIPPPLGTIAPSILLAANENPFGPGPFARQAIMRATQDAGRYPSQQKLISALAKTHGLTNEQILLSNGSNDVLDIIARTFLAPGDSVIVSQHAFMVYDIVSKAAGGIVTTIPAKVFAHDIDAIATAAKRAKIAWIANPNNPTGTLIPADDLWQAVARIPASCIVVIDEAYVDYLSVHEHIAPTRWLAEFNNVILVRTFSKMHGLAGLRVGYAVANSEIIASMNRVRQPFNVNGIGLAAALASLSDTKHHKKTKHQNSSALTMLMQTCDELGIAYVPSHANFLMVNIKKHPELFDALLRQGIATLPLSSYNLPHMLRISTGTPDQMKQLINTIHNSVSGNKSVQ